MKCYTRKKRETIGVFRHRPYAEMMVLATHSDVYERPPSACFPEAGPLFVVSRKIVRNKKRVSKEYDEQWASLGT